MSFLEPQMLAERLAPKKPKILWPRYRATLITMFTIFFLAVGAEWAGKWLGAGPIVGQICFGVEFFVAVVGVLLLLLRLDAEQRARTL